MAEKLIPELFAPAPPHLAAAGLLADTLLPAGPAAPPAPPAPDAPAADFWSGPALVDGRRATRREAAQALMAGGMGLGQAVAALLAAFAAPPEGAKGDLDPEGRWVTITGQHVHIDSAGQIDAGGHPELRKVLADKAGLVAKGEAPPPEPAKPEPAKPEPAKPAAKHKLKKVGKGDYEYRDHSIYRDDYHSNAYKPWHISPPSTKYGKSFSSLADARKAIDAKEADKEAAKGAAKPEPAKPEAKPESKPAAAKVAVSDFVMHTSYHPPTGLSKKGHNEYSFVSKDGRWHARQGNFDSMVLTDRHSGEVHVVKGKMPEVVAFAQKAA